MRQLHRHYSSKIWNLLLGFTVCLCLQLVGHAAGYSQVLVSGGGGAQDEGPKIFKALNMDLIYPRTFNSSERLVSTTETSISGMTTTESNWRQSQQQQYANPNTQQTQLMAAEQPILFVTPPTNNDQITAHHIAATINPTLAIVNSQQPLEQSDAYEIPTDILPADILSPLQEYASTGRAVDYNRPAYNFNQLITPLIKSPSIPAPPVRERPTIVETPTAAQQPSSIGQIVYPHAYNHRRPPNNAEINKLIGKAPFSDRFTPGEAVAAGQFAKQKHHNSGNKITAASQVVQQTYKPPANIYSFPPNINSPYTSPYQDPKIALPSSNVNSYVPPPSGPLVTAANGNGNNGYKYPGPTNPTNDDTKTPADEQKGLADGGDDNGSDDTIGVLPASAMGDGEKDMDGGGAAADAMADNLEHDHPPPDDDTEYPTPPPGWVEEHPETVQNSPHISHTPHDFHNPHSDHHLDFHDHFPSYPQYFHSYPDVTWDDHHHLHDHHHDHPPPTLPPAPTEIPPPEPPPEPRVKKYSYFYIGRKLWYIPLYFTVWFSFYVLWLILKSIARHKVNLPNHYVSRRSISDFNATEAKANEYINDLTVSVLEKIEKFQRYNRT